MLKLSSTGRGGGYSKKRGLVESTLAAMYRADWPARAWGLTRRSCAVHEIHFGVSGREPGRPPLTVGFVSDLHIGPTTPAAVLDAAFDALAAAEVDVLVLGGDYVFLEASPAKAARLRSLVERARGRLATVAVLGNHDLWTDHGVLEDALRAAGAEVAINAAVRLAPPHDDVAFVCLDDPWTGAPDAERALAGAAGATFRVGVCHSPDALPLMQRAGAHLFVCGHTHGGQIATPWGPIVVPGRVGKRYPSGRHTAFATHLFVSRGVGATELPMRAWARPDVALITLS